MFLMNLLFQRSPDLQVYERFRKSKMKLSELEEVKTVIMEKTSQANPEEPNTPIQTNKHLVDKKEEESSHPDHSIPLPVPDIEHSPPSNNSDTPLSINNDTNEDTKKGMTNDAFAKDEISTKRKISHQRSASYSLANENQVCYRRLNC